MIGTPLRQYTSIKLPTENSGTSGPDVFIISDSTYLSWILIFTV
ncbi:hypothetical protein [Fusobacterium sp. PH5-29]